MDLFGNGILKSANTMPSGGINLVAIETYVSLVRSISKTGHFNTCRERFPRALCAASRMCGTDWTLNGERPLHEPSTYKDFVYTLLKLLCIVLKSCRSVELEYHN